MAPVFHSPKFLAVFISITVVGIARAASVDATCYLPNGTAAYDNTGVMPVSDFRFLELLTWAICKLECPKRNHLLISNFVQYTPCNTNTKHSMCCRSSTTDRCRSDGLCDSNWDGNIWRVFCTDPTWQAPNCIKLCLFNGRDGDGMHLALRPNRHPAVSDELLHIGNSGGSVRVTQCDNGSYCCGNGTVADSCCNTGGGLWVGKDGNPTNIRPGSVTTTEQTTVTTSATSTVPTASPASQTTASAPGAVVTKTTTKPTTNTGAIAGGVVAGIIAAALIIAAAIWAMKRRRNRPMNQQPMAVPHADAKPPLYASEMEGSNAHGELPADTVIHEMSTGGLPMKQHRTVELA